MKKHVLSGLCSSQGPAARFHKVLCLPRNLHMEVHKVLRLPRSLHMEVHKVLRLPRNLSSSCFLRLSSPQRVPLTQALPHTSARRLQRLCCHVLRSSSSSPRPFQDCDNFCMALAKERRCVNSGVCCWRSPSFSHCPVHCPYHCLPHVLTVQLAFNLSLAPPFPLLLLSSPSFSCPVLTPSYILFRVATTVHAKGKVRANSFYIRGPGLEPTKSSDPSCFAIYKMACARVDRYRMMVPQDYYIMFTTIST